MKKKIAIVMGSLVVGGAERVLFNMLNRFDYSIYDVTLFICGDEKGHTENVNNCAKIKYFSSEFAGDTSVKALFKEFHPVKILYRLLAKLFKKDEKKNYMYYSRSLPFADNTEFDCVIAYKGWEAVNLRFAFNRLKGKKHIVWMHNNTYDENYPFPYFYHKADKIFCVCKTIAGNVQKLFGISPGKTEVFYNIPDISEIKAKANEACALNSPSILSVGRLSWEKGFEMIPEAAAILKERNVDFTWYIVGEGYKRKDIEQKIRDTGTEDRVILLGEKLNPYPYFRECDIFVQTSITEGFCTTTFEAKILGKPVITGNIPSMVEQFDSGINGIITDEISPDAFADAVEKLLSDSELSENIKNNLKQETFDEMHGFDILYKFINE